MNTPNVQPVWWERLAAFAALAALAGMLASSQTSCGGEDLVLSGVIPATATSATRTATATPDDEETEDDL